MNPLPAAIPNRLPQIMLPVYINSTAQGLSLKEFSNNLIEICQSHQNQGRASAFALIIYDFHNPQIEKILYDTEYWNSLHRISGQYLTIFSLFENPVRNILIKNGFPKYIRMKFEAVKVDSNKEVGIGYRQIIAIFFGDIEFKSPSILFFQVHDNIISDHFMITLKEQKIEEGFLEIKQVIEDSIEAIKNIKPDNRENYREIFHMVQTNVEASQSWKYIKKISGLVLGIARFAKIFT